MISIKNFLYMTFFIGTSIYCADNNDIYYDLSFLKNYALVRTRLESEGFREIFFKAADGLNINGLVLLRSNARCNVIVCAGWLPGKKEKMATFVAALPADCNILFFDARGHGKSEGPLFSEVWKYGINEYKDIVGAVHYLYTTNQLPIVICGICSGAFNATHAIISLQKDGLLEKYNVKGLVFDSGWGSITTVSKTVVLGNNEMPIVKLIKMLSSKSVKLDAIRESFLYKCLFYPIKVGIIIFHRLIVYPLVTRYESITNLFDKIHQIKIPIFFIHSSNDMHANIDDAWSLASLVENKQLWWIDEGSYHAWHHLKKKEVYKEKLADFINTALL